jgi:hypothetical protein
MDRNGQGSTGRRIEVDTLHEDVETDESAHEVLQVGDIRARVRRVPAYAQLADADIGLKDVPFDAVLPLQSVLARRKVERAREVIRLHAQLGLAAFTPLALPPRWSPDRGLQRPAVDARDLRAHLWFPPILEQHGRGYVVLDGHHRLYMLLRLCLPRLDGLDGVEGLEDIYTLGVRALVIRNVPERLPATPFESARDWLHEVREDESHYARGRGSRYRGFDPRFWRDLSAMYSPNSTPGARLLDG